MKKEDFEVNTHSRSGPIPSAFMYNYYMKGMKMQDDGVSVMEMAILEMKDIELQLAFKELIDKGVFTVEKKVTIVKIHPENIDKLQPSLFKNMLLDLHKEGFFKENPHAAVELEEPKKRTRPRTLGVTQEVYT